uniref:Uncharacterized protein n=1 Tax=Rhizophora mucronata TaxID=61149 RepID=A0A2P2N8P6_RHIMU
MAVCEEMMTKVTVFKINGEKKKQSRNKFPNIYLTQACSCNTMFKHW